MERNERIINYSKGNFGAVEFLTKVYDSPFSILIFIKLEMCQSIRGTNLYVLYSDLCEKDMSKVVLLIKNCPKKILEDACSRQDRSGVSIVKKYLDPNFVQEPQIKPTYSTDGKNVLFDEICPDCVYGKKHTIQDMDVNDLSDTATVTIDECQTCKGTGTITKKINI